MDSQVLKRVMTSISICKNIDNDDTTFVVINSTCGCAAGLARPAAVAVAEQNEVKPDHKVTVFAGQDKEATQTMRDYIQQVPSSPHTHYLKVNI